MEQSSKPFRFALSLRFRHPSMPSEEISRAIGMQPQFHWNAGEPRVTPTGIALRGVREETYWSSGDLHSECPDLVDAIAANLTSLEPHKDFLREFVTTGGEIEYFIGWFTTDTSGGETLDWELLQRLADFKISLGLDVYGNK
jgi:hypothetical protein